MIVPRQKLFNKVDFDYYDYHKKKGDLTPEDEHKFETLKRKYSKEWEEHQRKNSGGSSSSYGGGSSSYGSGSGSGPSSGGGYSRTSSSSGSSNSYGGSSSSSSSSQSSKSKSSSHSDDDFDFDEWYKDFDRRTKKNREDFERNRKAAQDAFRERQEEYERQRREREEGMKHDKEQLGKAAAIAGNASSIWFGKSIGKLVARQVRRDRVNAKVGHDKKMKDSDRKRIEELKVMPDSDKKLLKTIAEGKNKDEVKKAERKYKIKKVAIGALDKSVTGASVGGDIGALYDSFKVASSSKFGTSKGVERTVKGMGYGSLGGAVFGAGLNAYRANKQVNKTKNSKDKEREVDRINVGSGKMTEHEFVRKHGGRKD